MLRFVAFLAILIVKETISMRVANEKWFRDQLEYHGFTQRHVAKVIKLDAAAFSRTIRGERKLLLHEATELARLFGVPVEEVLAAAGAKTEAMQSRDSMRLSGWVDGELNIHWEAPSGAKTVPKPFMSGKDVRAVRYQTSGSALEAMDGTLVYYKEGSGGVSSDAMGRLCLVEASVSKRSRLCVVKKGYRTGTYNLTTLDGRLLEESVTLKYAYPVVWMKL